MNSICLGKEDVTVKDHGNNSVLEAMLLIIDALSQKEGKEKLFSQLTNKHFSGLDIPRKEDKNKGLPEICNKANESDGKAAFLQSSLQGSIKEDAKLQAAMLCAQALSCSKVDEETRLFTLGKIFEGFVNVHMDQRQDNKLGFSFHKENARGNAQSELKDGLSVNSNKEIHEEVFLFLKDVCAQGDFQLKDVSKMLKCVTNMEKLKGETNVMQHALSEQANANFENSELFDAIGKQEEKDISNEDDDLQGPLDNNHPVIVQGTVPNEAIVPRKENLSLLSGDLGKDVCPCTHVPQQLHSTACLAEEKDREETTPNFFTSKSFCPFSGKSDKKNEFENKSHVTSNTPPLSFLEAVKSCKKDAYCKELINIRDDKSKNGQSRSSSSDDSPFFKIDDKIFLQRMEMCKFSVVAKLTLVKGEEPWFWTKLKEKLDGVWKLKSDWRLISLGKGFYHVILHSQEELDKVWSKGSLHLKPGVLRLQSWNFCFDPTKQKSTTVQVWIRIHNLPWFLWEHSVLSGIARKVGIPLRIDKTTVEGSFGHFARVLVEIDISKPIKSKVLAECNGQVFEVNIVPEHIPSFCKGCNNIGHSTNDCRLMSKKMVDVRTDKGFMGSERALQKHDMATKANLAGPSSSITKPAKRKIEGKENSSTRVIPSIQSDKVNTEMNIVEMVTDFSAQFVDHSIKNTSSDCLIFSNQFSVLQPEDEVEDTVQNNDKASPQVSNIQLCDAKEEIIPKLPHRWSDVLDDEDEKEKTYSLQEVNDSILRATSKFHHTFNSMSDFRAQLDDVWISRDDSRFDRDMSAEIDHASYSPKHSTSLITHIPRKDKKVKIGFRQPPPK